MAEDKYPVNLRASMLILREDSVLLCRRFDEPNSWVIPGGTPRLGEGCGSAASREVLEETGLDVVAHRVAFVLDIRGPDADQDITEIVFLGVGATHGTWPTQWEERLGPAFVPLQSIGDIGLRPPIAGYIRGFAAQAHYVGARQSTAAYLGNLWRAAEAK